MLSLPRHPEFVSGSRLSKVPLVKNKTLQIKLLQGFSFTVYTKVYTRKNFKRS